MKSIYLVGALALTCAFACTSNTETEETKVVETETVKEVETVTPEPEVVKVEAEPTKVVVVEKPAKTVVIEKEEEKGTSIKIGKDGGSFKNKDIDIDLNN